MTQLFKISLTLLLSITGLTQVFSTSPAEDCGGHPICGGSGDGAIFDVIGNVIASGIQYVAVIAVIAVMIGGIMYLISSGDEEKTKKAKNVIIWALIGVFLSVGAMALINIVNNFRIF